MTGVDVVDPTFFLDCEKRHIVVYGLLTTLSDVEYFV